MAATIYIRELFRQRASQAVTAQRGGRAERSYETAWRVWKADGGRPLSFTATEALNAVVAEHPYNEPFSGMTGVKLLRLEPQEHAPYVFDVTGSYGVPETPEIPDDFNNFISQSQSQRSPSNPHGAKISRDIVMIDEYSYKDFKNKWFTNSAGDPLQELIPFPVGLRVWRVQLNMASLPDDSAVGMANGRKLYAGQRCEAELHVNLATGVYTPYWSVSFEMWVHPIRDWVPTIVWDAGYNQLVDGKLEPIINPKTSQAYNTVRFLDLNGKALAPKVDPKELKFYVREEGQFSIPFLT